LISSTNNDDLSLSAKERLTCKQGKRLSEA
jgi:hypothetical protein